MFLKRFIQWYGMLCYPMLWYGMERMVWYEISMLCYEISMLCYGVVYVVKHKHSATVVYSNLLIKTSKISDIRMEATIWLVIWIITDYNK